MMIPRFVFLSIIFLCTFFPAVAEETRIFSYTYYITAGDERAASRAIQTLAVEKGGYLKNLSAGQLTVRLAPAYNDELKALFAGYGYILDEQTVREDAGEKLVDLSSSLAVKEKLLKELYSLFNASQFHQTLDVEKEIGRLTVEIEQIKGEIAFYRDRAALSDFTIHLNVIPPAVKTETGTGWKWLNDLGIPGLVEEESDED